MSNPRTSKRITRIPLKFKDLVYTLTSKKNKHKIDDMVENKDDSRIDNEDESRDTTDEGDSCKEDNGRSGEQGNEVNNAQVRVELSENIDDTNEPIKICQSNVSTLEPIVEATVNNENNVITANHVQSSQVNVDCKNCIYSDAEIVSSGNDELSKELIYIPTGVNENGDEVVIFEEELVKEGSKKW
ncbi:hypothetical protein Tco_0408332 [Tanacetum coccineum]